MRIVLDLSRTDRSSGAYRNLSELSGRVTYAVQVEVDDRHGPRSGKITSASLDWSKLAPLLDQLRAPGRERLLGQRIGELLRAFLRGTDWDQCEAWLQQRVVASASVDQPVHVTIRSTAPELLVPPWELLPWPEPGNLTLADIAQTVIAFSAHPGNIPGRVHDEEPGRLLFAWSAAAGQLPSASHCQALADASHPGAPIAFDPDRDVLAEVTPQALHAQLTDRVLPPVVALHVLCHGSVEMSDDGQMTGQTTGLAWRDPDGGVAHIAPERLARWLAPVARSLRVVTLCACDSGDSAGDNREFGSASQAVHRLGIPWVAGSRYALSKPGSETFARHFYGRLLRAPSVTVEQAFAHARSQLSFDIRRDEHVNIQLYARHSERGRPPFAAPDAAGDTKSPLASDSRSAVAHWLDRPGLPPDAAETLELCQLLASVYQTPELIDHIASLAGIPAPTLPGATSARTRWYHVLQRAAEDQRMRALLAKVGRDPLAAAIHRRLGELAGWA